MVEAGVDGCGELGTERLVESLVSHRGASLQESVDAVQEMVERWCTPGEPEDDVTILAFEVMS